MHTDHHQNHNNVHELGTDMRKLSVLIVLLYQKFKTPLHDQSFKLYLQSKAECGYVCIKSIPYLKCIACDITVVMKEFTTHTLMFLMFDTQNCM